MPSPISSKPRASRLYSVSVLGWLVMGVPILALLLAYSDGLNNKHVLCANLIQYGIVCFPDPNHSNLVDFSTA